MRPILYMSIVIVSWPSSTVINIVCKKSIVYWRGVGEGGYFSKTFTSNFHKNNLEKRILQKKSEPAILENSRGGFIEIVHEN